MQILDLYTALQESLGRGYKGYAIFETDPRLQPLLGIARGWRLDQSAIERWFKSPDGVRQSALAKAFLAEAPNVVEKVESVFGRELPGELLLMPSFGEFDGFARYELGHHRVMLGIDFPDADLDYLRALTAHELSHVYRDHSPEVWSHLGKPLAEITRKEYLDATEADEHLVSEGLATLFSQIVFPEIAARVHHFYEEEEWAWCLENEARIEAALLECLTGDADVWSFYSESRAGEGSPSRIQYYWAARKLEMAIVAATDRQNALVRLHESPSRAFAVFMSPTKK